MNRWHKTVLAGMLSVAIAFGLAIPLGFWLRAQYRAIPNEAIAAIAVMTLVGVAAGLMRVLNGPLWLTRKKGSIAGRRPDPDGVEMPRTGYEMTFDDFKRLLYERQSQAAVASLLKNWYGYEVVAKGGNPIVRSLDGSVVGLRVLYNQIQSDPAKQHEVYQEAMSFWR
jgi:hypothetical protein